MFVQHEVAMNDLSYNLRNVKKKKRELIELRDWAPAHADEWNGTGGMR